MKKVQIRIENPGLFKNGIVLVLLGLIMPCILTVYNMGVYRSAMAALSEENQITVLEAAMRLWALNTIRAVPHYLGAFYIADAVSIEMTGHGNSIIKGILAGGIILLVYQMIERFYGIQYDIGTTAICMILIIILFISIDFKMVSPRKKAILVVFLLLTFQCMDVCPALSAYGFGRGETSRMIKEIAEFLGANRELNFSTFLLMAILMTSFLLQIMLIADENRIRAVNQEKESKTKELIEIRLQALQSRNYMEMEQLVHDLKTPLTSILTLVGVLKMNPPKEKQDEYLNNIEISVENLSIQISEILDEDRCVVVTAEHLIMDLLAQISNMPYASIVHIDIKDGDACLAVNRIRFSRMLVNVIENAYYAIDHDHGEIMCRVFREEKNNTAMVKFEVSDNGHGMDENVIASIFNMGFSTRGSSGLGLSFIKSVVERHKGVIEVESEIRKGTTISIWIPEGEKDGEEDSYFMYR